MTRIALLLVMLAAVPSQVLAQSAGPGQQIRIDGNTCKTIGPEYQRKKSDPLYAKAVTAQKAGKANPMQQQRIADVEFLRGALKAAKCKGVK
jgi:hypothetical protein